MYCVQTRILCNVCNKSYKANNYPIHSKSQGHIINVLKDDCTISTMVKTHFIKK